MLGRRDALKGDPALAAARYQGPVLDAAAVDLAQADCVIDALFGAGLARDIDGEAKAIIERINAFKRAGGPVLAVDVPSGIDGETGKIRGAAVEASASVTFFRLKPGHLLLPGRTHAGAIRLADIGIPEAALGPIAPKAFVNAPAVWRAALPRPAPPATNMRAARCSSCRARATIRARPGSPPARLCAPAPALSASRARPTRSRSTPRT